MKISGRVISKKDTAFGAGAIAKTYRDVPVVIDGDSYRLIGKATIYADGSAELQIDEPKEVRKPEDDEFGLGFVVEQEHNEGQVRVIDRLRPISVILSSEKLVELLKRGQ